ncbi:uncharacterized protein [Ptychodera flava]|uniref:uncharacterized protein isoform X1 n=1 Tax=Ptychodera flava TaxID=63121 RepID=UPI003969BE36
MCLSGVITQTNGLQTLHNNNLHVHGKVHVKSRKMSPRVIMMWSKQRNENCLTVPDYYFWQSARKIFAIEVCEYTKYLEKKPSKLSKRKSLLRDELSAVLTEVKQQLTSPVQMQSVPSTSSLNCLI